MYRQQREFDMTDREKLQLEDLLKIAEEDDSPLNDWEKEFLEALESRSHFTMTEKQANVFERLVAKHLKD
jgi:hypothetical protein